MQASFCSLPTAQYDWGKIYNRVDKSHFKFMTTSRSRPRAALQPSYDSASQGYVPIVPGDCAILFPFSNSLPSADDLIFRSTANSGAVRRERASALCHPPTPAPVLDTASPITLQSVLLSKASLLYWCPGFHLLSHRRLFTPASLKRCLHLASKIPFS